MTKNSKQHGLGRRKRAIAQIFLTDDPKEQTINGVVLRDYFPTVAMQTVAVRPLEITSQGDTFGIKAKVQGGGKQAQAQAVSLAIARALVSSDEGWRKQLKAGGLLTRDSRIKERKKPGLKRARRAPQFSKR